MATLIIEIPGRNTNLYHKIDKPVVRVGRALDNDLILADPTVSPYHFLIRKNDIGRFTLYPLADENGIRRNGKQLLEPFELNDLPIDFDAGRTRVRILDSAQDVAPTRLISGHDGSARIFGHWGWSLLLFVAMASFTAADHFLSTPRVLDWDSYGGELTFTIIVVLGLSIGLLAINRFISHRWDYPSALSLVSLILIGALLLEWMIPVIDYYFTSSMPGIVINLIWTLLLLPVLLGWFLIRLHHGSTLASIIFVAFLLSPAAFVHIKDFVERYNIPPGFSKTAYYNNTLHPWDRRSKSEISIDEFFESALHLASSASSGK